MKPPNSAGKSGSTSLAAELAHANQLRKAGRLAEAEECFRRLIAKSPQHADTYNQLGIMLAIQGRSAEAQSAFEEAVRRKPDFPEAHNNFGTFLRRQGKFAEALPCFQEAIRQNPDYAVPYNNLGVTLVDLGRPAEAEACFRKALALNPDYPEVLHNLGGIFARSDKPEEAVRHYRNALRLRPDFIAVINDLAGVLTDLRSLDEAEHLCHGLLKTHPEYAEAHHNHGRALAARDRHEEALTAFQEALRLKPGAIEIQSDLAFSMGKMGQLEQSLSCYGRILSVSPDHVLARWNRGLIYLLSGELELGWPDYEYRLQLKNYLQPHFTQPRWDGSRQPGKVVLLNAEQGLGDTLHFIRYAPLVKERVGAVIVACAPEVAGLLTGLEGVDRVIPNGTVLPHFDIHAPLPSLPGIFQTRRWTIPARIPYLSANPAKVAQWQAELSQLAGLKVGLVFQGDPNHKGDRQRSVPLAHFEPLSRVPGVTLISLQVGVGTRQLADAPFPITDLGSRFDLASMDDLAAVVRGLDLLVAVDTAVVHLAGGLGAPAWVLLPSAPDWRWLLNRRDSPWYPTLRLYRQERRGDWGPVIERLRTDLDSLAKLSNPGRRS